MCPENNKQDTFDSRLRAFLEKRQQLFEESSGIIRQALTYVDSHYHAIKKVHEIAIHLGVNYHTLRGRTRRETGFTLEEHLSMSRVAHALNLITNSDLLIKEISWEVGYKYEDLLARSMKKWLGATPQVIRRQSLAYRVVSSGMVKAIKLIQSN